MPPSGIGDLGPYGNALLEQAQALDTKTLHHRHFFLHGLRVRAYFSDEAYADLCTRNLATEQTDGTTTADATLYLLDSESVGWSQPRHRSTEFHKRRDANAELAYLGLRGAYLPQPTVWQFYSANLQLGVQLISRPGAMPPWEFGGPLRVFLHWAYSSRGRRLCHSASLGINGKGILLVGPGGTGKSATTLAGIAEGLQTVGDDYCQIAQGDRISAHPLYRILKQDSSGVVRAFGEVAPERLGPVNWQDKHEIHESQLLRSPFVSSLEIRAIVVPRVARLPKSVIRPISPGAAMRAFAPSSTFQLPDGELESIAFSAELCRRVPCVEVQLSEDASEIASTLRQYIEHGTA